MLTPDQADMFGVTGKKPGDTVSLKISGKVNSSDDGGLSLEILSATPMDDDAAPDANGTVTDAADKKGKPRMLSRSEAGFNT